MCFISNDSSLEIIVVVTVVLMDRDDFYRPHTREVDLSPSVSPLPSPRQEGVKEVIDCVIIVIR